MKWKYESFLEKRERLSKWQETFAWLPVYTNEGYVAWLCTVEQRADWIIESGWDFEYRIKR